MKKFITLLSIFVFISQFSFSQNFRTEEEMKNAVDLYIYFGNHLNSCKDKCDMQYCNNIISSWYSQANKDYYYSKNEQMNQAAVKSESSIYKVSKCGCEQYEAVNLKSKTNDTQQNISNKPLGTPELINELSKSLLELLKK